MAKREENKEWSWKKSKKSKKATNKTSDDPSIEENDKRPAKRQRMTPHKVVEVVQQIASSNQLSSDLFLDEFDAYICSQLT